MKIHLANQSKQLLGGGFTFMHNLRKGLELIKADIEFIDEPGEEDIFFIASSSMVNDRQLVQDAKAKGKKIILRVDNIPRNSRNRNTGTTKLYDYAQLADHVVFQSEWAKNKMMPLLDADRDDISNQYNNKMYGEGGKKQFDEKRSTIILNGVDTAIFKPQGDLIPKDDVSTRYLIIRYNRDNNKRIEEALDMFTERWLEDKNSELFIVGNFSKELVSGYFDFYLGEWYRYFGVVEDRTKLAGIIRSCDALLYPSYSDACPNTVLEARASDIDVIHKGHAGIPEVMTMEDMTLERMAREYLELFKELCV